MRFPHHRSRREPEPPVDPERRANLLRHALEFVRAARDVHGVTRIAVIGSILTEKRQPKDIDLLVTITDDADVSALARIGRRLQGRGQSIASGADIFLADTADRYIGRVCHYRECWRRRDCLARHCGLRGHINDDLDNVCLPDALIREPPLVLWPEPTERTVIPADVSKLLIQPLQSEVPEATPQPG